MNEKGIKYQVGGLRGSQVPKFAKYGIFWMWVMVAVKIGQLIFSEKCAIIDEGEY